MESEHNGQLINVAHATFGERILSEERMPRINLISWQNCYTIRHVRSQQTQVLSRLGSAGRPYLMSSNRPQVSPKRFDAGRMCRTRYGATKFHHGVVVTVAKLAFKRVNSRA